MQVLERCSAGENTSCCSREVKFSSRQEPVIPSSQPGQSLLLSAKVNLHKCACMHTHAHN